MARSRKVKQTWVLFIVTFLVSLIIITYFIKSMSPDVDVEIGGDDTQTSFEESSDSDIKQAIDDRLRWIQMEDNMPGVSKRDDGMTSEEINYEPANKDKSDYNTDKPKIQNEEQQTNGNELAPIEYVNPQQHKSIVQPPIPAQQPAEPFKMSKVYVGSYPTIEQAIQAQNKLMNTSLSVSPFVKEVNGSYVLQAGSYADSAKAEAVAKEISAVGFHARVVKE